MDRTKIRMSNINFHKLIVLIRVPPRTHLQKGRWLVEAGWGGGGGVQGEKFRPSKCLW